MVEISVFDKISPWPIEIECTKKDLILSDANGEYMRIDAYLGHKDQVAANFVLFKHAYDMYLLIDNIMKYSATGIDDLTAIKLIRRRAYRIDEKIKNELAVLEASAANKELKHKEFATRLHKCLCSLSDTCDFDSESNQTNPWILKEHKCYLDKVIRLDQAYGEKKLDKFIFMLENTKND